MRDLSLEEQGSHLYRASHCAESKDGGTVFYRGLVIEGSLSVHQHYCHLQDIKKSICHEDCQSNYVTNLKSFFS